MPPKKTRGSSGGANQSLMLRQKRQEAAQEFYREKESFLTTLPVSVKRNFGQIGFAPWRDKYLPVLVLDPFRAPPAARKTFLQEFRIRQRIGTPLESMSFLVYWYGEEDQRCFYSQVPQDRFVPYGEATKEMLAFAENNNTKKQFIARAKRELEADLRKEPKDRTRGVAIWKELHETLSIRDIRKQEENGIHGCTVKEGKNDVHGRSASLDETNGPPESKRRRAGWGSETADQGASHQNELAFRYTSLAEATSSKRKRSDANGETVPALERGSLLPPKTVRQPTVSNDVSSASSAEEISSERDSLLAKCRELEQQYRALEERTGRELAKVSAERDRAIHKCRWFEERNQVLEQEKKDRKIREGTNAHETASERDHLLSRCNALEEENHTLQRQHRKELGEATGDLERALARYRKIQELNTALEHDKEEIGNRLMDERADAATIRKDMEMENNSLREELGEARATLIRQERELQNRPFPVASTSNNDNHTQLEIEELRAALEASQEKQKFQEAKYAGVKEAHMDEINRKDAKLDEIYGRLAAAEKKSHDLAGRNLELVQLEDEIRTEKQDLALQLVEKDERLSELCGTMEQNKQTIDETRAENEKLVCQVIEKDNQLSELRGILNQKQHKTAEHREAMLGRISEPEQSNKNHSCDFCQQEQVVAGVSTSNVKEEDPNPDQLNEDGSLGYGNEQVLHNNHN